MKRWWRMVFLFLVLGGASPQPQLYLGNKLVYSCPSFLVSEGVVYLPYRESAQALGLSVQADFKNQALFYRTRSQLVIVDGRRKQALLGTQVFALRYAPVWAKDQVFVPEEVFTGVLSKALGVEVRIVYPHPSSQGATPGHSSSGGNPSPGASSSPPAAGNSAAPAPHVSSSATMAPGSTLPGGSGVNPGLRNPVDVIVIDPGHGGHDSGAKGPSGMVEKEITLSLAKKLRERLQEKGVVVFLTRENDTFIPLRERPAKAREKKADVFLSLHANAHQRLSAQGVETFFASLRATDKAALELARLENEAGGESGSGPVSGGEVGLILSDMASAEVLAESERLAVLLQEELAGALKFPNRGVKQAPFRVLLDATMPAALVEVGFLTSPEESKLISSPEVQDKIVNALCVALIRYRDQTNARLGLPAPTPSASQEKR